MRRQLLVEIDDAVTDLLAQAGFHPRYGARPRSARSSSG